MTADGSSQPAARPRRLAEQLGPEEFRRLVRLGAERNVATGDTLIHEGASDNELYVVREGELGVRRGGVDQAILGPGDVAGEMAFIDERPRSATVYARRPTQVIALDRRRVFEGLIGDPAALGRLISALAQHMAVRLADSGRPPVIDRLIAGGQAEAGSAPVTEPAEGAAFNVDAWLERLITESIAHRAVHHPYLKRLASGDLPDIQWALRDYASQYYGYSAQFPRYLTAVISKLRNPDHRHHLLQNLLEEGGHLEDEEKKALAGVGIDASWVDGVPHPRLFRQLQEALGANAFVEEDEDSLEVLCWRETFFDTLSHGSEAQAIGALGLGTEGIVKHFYRYLAARGESGRAYPEA